MITKIQNTDNYSYRYANIFMGGQASPTFLRQVQSMRQTLPFQRLSNTVIEVLKIESKQQSVGKYSSQYDISDLLNKTGPPPRQRGAILIIILLLPSE